MLMLLKELGFIVTKTTIEYFLFLYNDTSTNHNRLRNSYFICNDIDLEMCSQKDTQVPGTSSHIASFIIVLTH